MKTPALPRAGFVPEDGFLRPVRETLASFMEGDDAELIVTLEDRLHLEHEPVTGQFTEARGMSAEVHARVWKAGLEGRASLPFSGENLRGALESARRSLEDPGVARGVPSALTPSRPPREKGMERERIVAFSRELGAAVSRRSVPIQALFARQLCRTHVLVRRSGETLVWTEGLEDALLRVETSQGAVVDGVGVPLERAVAEVTPVLERLELARSALESPDRGVPDMALPVVFAPAVSTQWIAAFAPLLRADVAAHTFGAHVGKKLFASCVTLRDDPLEPRGPVARELDDQGAAASKWELVQQGRLQGFLHSDAAGAAPGAYGRAVRQNGTVAPGWSNFFLAPSPTPLTLPEDRLEVCARVETFSPRPRAGRLELLIAGFEVRGGKRTRAFGPLPLEGAALGFLRRIQGVGQDLTFFPTTEGCGAPSVLLASLSPGSNP